MEDQLFQTILAFIGILLGIIGALLAWQFNRVTNALEKVSEVVAELSRAMAVLQTISESQEKRIERIEATEFRPPAPAR